MKMRCRRLVHVSVLALLGLGLGAAECQAAEPTLARLSFWVPPGRIEEFETAYYEKLTPILKTHGLVESTQRSRATVDSIFSRLFELNAPSEITPKRRALRKDPAWIRARKHLGLTFRTTRRDSLIPATFRIYAMPAGSGETVAAGPGRDFRAGVGIQQGAWQTFGIPDGLLHSMVWSISQDGKGYMWFGSPNGVSRYDGRTFTTFTREDGLAHSWVEIIVQDRDGNLWFGTGDGVSRYDGKTFITLSAADGLAARQVTSILQDRQGDFWFGTYGGGVSRYDGETFTTFTTEDGLASNILYSIFQDREGHLWFGTSGGGVSRFSGKSFTSPKISVFTEGTQPRSLDARAR
ncbi:MAG: two-component regulator propeller domain-containing protein [Candidatus Latescibacteria bacterium]|jgi:hypothetical protein|nr:two-component regulator propeller domain-containing protein [Candidatus Latescibacterota bacterium]